MRRRWPHGAILVVALFGLHATVARAQVPAGGEFRANTYTTAGQVAPSLGMGPNGDFVGAWMSSGQDGSSYGVFAQRYSRDGSPLGAEFLVNSYTTAGQGNVDVAVDRRGGFVIVWQSWGQDGDGGGIFGQHYGPDGAALGPEFQVNGATAGSQDYPGVATDARGAFVVTWISSDGDGPGNFGVRARRFDRSAAPIGSEFAVNTYTTSDQDRPQPAVAPDGSFVVVWHSRGGQDGSGIGVFGQRFAASGAPAGAEFQVNAYTTFDQYGPSVGAAADGSFVVTWEGVEGGGAYQEVRSQRFDPAGNRVGGEFRVNTYTLGSQNHSGLAVDAQGNHHVIWNDYGRDGSEQGLFGWRISSTDTRRGAEFQANTNTTGAQYLSSIGADEVGNFVVLWDSYGQDGYHYGIYGQRFGGLFPASLAVDPAGNRVLEPGETVEVRSSWTNLNGAAQAFASTLSNPSGPAGPTYTITDGSADYGSVANGATTPCADCFAVSVSGARPATHWDASALESLTPDTQGQQKRWSLHVGDSFSDVSGSSPFYPFIETLLHHGVTGGCSTSQYCPTSSATREQMAVFVLAAKEGAGYSPQACGTPQFPDVPNTSPFCRFVEELARRGVVSGCGGGNYCPSSPVTREQMAVFTLVTLDPTINPPACTTPMFNDVPASSPFCRFVEELARRGVVSGCGGGNYCPSDPVSREQMGVFISATFGLALYGV